MTPTRPRLETLAWSHGESIGHERIKQWIARGDTRIPLNLAQAIDFNLILSYDDLYRTHYPTQPA
jgi:hypothetical protein